MDDNIKEAFNRWREGRLPSLKCSTAKIREALQATEQLAERIREELQKQRLTSARRQELERSERDVADELDQLKTGLAEAEKHEAKAKGSIFTSKPIQHSVICASPICMHLCFCILILLAQLLSTPAAGTFARMPL